MKIVMLAAAALLVPSAASAADLCKTRFLQPVGAIEDAKSIMRPGDIGEAVTQYVKERTGRSYYCSHGGYCYPDYKIVKGHRVVAQELTNCTIDRTSADVSRDETTYYLKVDRSRNSAADLLRDDTENALLALGS